MTPKKSPLAFVTGLVLVLGLGAVGVLVGNLFSHGDTEVAASVYETPIPIADFTLTDQTDRAFTFSSTRGKVVLMAFLFTHCGDVCPFSALKMGLVLEKLGSRASEVELVAVSTDPARDTVPVIADYSRDLGLFDRWHYVTGEVATMQKLYKDLKITVVLSQEEEVLSTKSATELGLGHSSGHGPSPLDGLNDAQVAAGFAVAEKYSGGYNVAHAAPFWVIDPQGQLRASLEVNATPEQIAQAIRTYLD